MWAKEFLLSGRLILIRELAPMSDDVDDIVLQSFKGDDLEEFLTLLREADDPVLRLTEGIDISIFERSSFSAIISYEEVVDGQDERSLFIALLVVTSVCLVALISVFAAIQRTRRKDSDLLVRLR